MELEQLEAEVLALPKDAQIELLARLLKYLIQFPESGAKLRESVRRLVLPLGSREPSE